MATILLVDDDVDLVQMNRRVLEHRGHSVVCANTAEEARELLKTTQPELAVVDVMMESQTAGFDLAREIHQRLPEVPMIVLSGIHEATGVPFRFEPDETWLPVLKFLDKPVAPADLAGEIENILSR